MIDGTLLAAEPLAIPASALSMARRALSGEDLARFEAVTLYAIRYMSRPDQLLSSVGANSWLLSAASGWPFDIPCYRL